MSKTNKVMTHDQAVILALLIADGRRFDSANIHPYSGVLTAARDWDSTLIEPDGRVAYDSAAPRGQADADGREIRPGLAVYMDEPGGGLNGRIVHHLEGDTWRVWTGNGLTFACAADTLNQPMGGEV